jgi:hypothetical protein
MRLLLWNSNACWRRMFRRELLRRYSELRREGNFPGSKLSGFCSGGNRNSAEKGISRGANCQVFAPAVFEIRRAPRVFLYRFAHFSCSHGQGCNTAYIKIRQIEYRRSKNCSAGSPPPRGNPGRKCTRTDAILK